jgi:ketosteroid isomerase-like protein
MTDAVQLVREWLTVVASGPAEAWVSKAAKDIVIRLPFAPPGVPVELRGSEAIDSLRPTWQATMQFRWHEVLIRKTEDRELFLTTARSEVTLQSGQRYANSYIMLTRLRQGLVLEHVEYFNPLPVMAAFQLSN